MKNIVTTLLLLTLFMLEGNAQENTFIEGANSFTSDQKKNMGFTVGFHSGAGFASMGKLESDLKKNTTFGDKFFIRGLGSLWGFDAQGLFASKFLVGFTYNRMAFDASESEKGQSKVKTNTLGGNVGFVVYNKNHYLIYPYAGYQAGKSTMSLTNYGNVDITFGDNATIERITAKEFESSTGLAEIGAGFRYFLRDEGTLMIGIDAGAYFNVGSKNWEGSGVSVSQVSTPSLAGGYIRFTVGGGLFSTKF